ncbi:predicted GPI-anchored protein 58 [Panicum virgatum]|uniref:Uncharacterized protein n=1 Tax=Panicum virgatum TaxID=38727 RepID=A0A8T0V129_PANVG|nr:predicted GPI-anchored protein 58 [Panicum virgatum]KAG2625949.1 hypothetical protein PVAP13_3KG283300 [Panicum virgatum]
MVLMAGASDSDSDHHATAKAAPAPAPSAPASSPSPSPAPAAARTRLHDFSFPTLSWGTHRLLRCSKDGASASPPPHPQTPSPGKEKPQGQQASPGATGASQPPRPWNLRTRRSATVAPLASRSEGACKAAAAHQPLASPPAKRGFSASLTKEEIAEDFAAIRGTRPPRRPKKRPRAVQRQLDMLYPGLSLADVNLDSYKIEER